MTKGLSTSVRSAGIAGLLCGGVLLLSHPAFTAQGPGGARGGGRPSSPITPGGPAAPSPSVPQGAIRKPAPKSPKKEVLPAVPPPGNAIMPVSEVRPGMKGYGLTVFQGTKIERFNVDVLGVLPRMNMGQPLVLVRLTGGPISERGAYLIQGMSGSPIYIEGKLLGAFSMGNAWPKEPIGMVTPIENMMEALDPKLSEIPAGQSAQDFQPGPDFAGGAGAGIFASTPESRGAEYRGQSFKPLAIPVAVSGLSGRNLDRLAGVLKPYNMSVMQGPGSMGSVQPFKAELTPGAGIGVVLMSGDVEMTGIGTVTYRKGNELLAFGHPMMQIGAAQFPITTAWIHDVFPSLEVSYKIGSAGEMVGTLTQDRPFSIAGRIGPLPAMVPIRYTVDDKATGRTRTFNVKAANHPLLVGQLLPMAVNQGLYSMRPVPGDTFARVKLTVETENAGTITRENVFYDPAMIDVAAVRDLMEVMGLLSNNAFRRVPVKSVDMHVTLEEKRPTATVERIFLSQEKFEPGDEVEVGVMLRPYRKEPVLLKTKVKVPENASNGRAVLMVQGGATRVDLSALMTGGMPGMLPSSPPPDASLRQVLKRFSERERNDQVVVRLVFPTAAVNINGERLSQLPSTIVDVMRSSKTTGFRIEREEAKKVEDTDYVVQGLQSLSITVEKEDHGEQPKSGVTRPSTPAGSSIGASTGGSPGTPLSVGRDLDDAEDASVRIMVDGQPRVLRLTPELEEEDADEEDKPKKAEPKKPEAPKTDKNGKKPSTPPAGSPPPTAPAASATPATPATTTPAADAKLVGRQATLWTQSAQADFERGTLDHAAVSTNGEVRMAPTLRLLHESSEQYVWSVQPMGNAIYAGTGNGGRVLKVDNEGQATVFCKTGELEVHALAKDKDGNLYAGTSPNGKVLKIGPDGKATELFSLNGAEAASDAGSKFILSLAVGADGTLYAGAGPKARILQMKPGEKMTELCSLPDSSITSLLVAPDGVVYAGTSEEGAVYRIQPNGSSTIVYDTDQSSITGLALDKAGNLYASTAPSGSIYKIEPDGAPRLHFTKSKGAIYDLKSDGAGNLYACSANTIMRVEPDGSATLLVDRNKAQFMALAWDDQGRLVAGSANVGSVYRVEPSTSGSFVSTVHDAKLPARWGRVRYTGVLPPDGSLVVETRSGNTPEPDASWSDWQAPQVNQGSMFVSSPTARFLQYRVLFKAGSGAAALRDISFSYLPRNQAPVLVLGAPLGGEIVQGKQTLKWTAADPDKDTLTYELSYSSDNGRTWKSLGETSAPAAPTASASTAAPTARGTAEQALKRYRDELDKDASLTPAQRDEGYDKAKALVERYLKEQEDSGASKAAPSPTPTAPAAPAATPPAASASKTPGVTREPTFVWDTKQVSDGIYILRIVATDRASNPSEPLSVTKITEPFIVNNTPPQVFIFERGITVGADKTAPVVGFVTGRVALKGAQYRIGTGEWQAIEAEDGIWDSSFEHFRFSATPSGSGEQTMEVKVVDAAGNVQVSKVKFTAP